MIDFLEIEVDRSQCGTCFNQCKYTLELISDSGLADARVFDTPMEQLLKLTSKEFDDTKTPHSPHYPSLVDDGPSRIICFAVQTYGNSCINQKFLIWMMLLGF